MDIYTASLPSIAPGASSGIVWGIVALVLILFSIYSGVLSYHWFKYGVKKSIVSSVTTLYFSVAVVLIILMFIFASRI